MVNHSASLLINLNLNKVDPLVENYILGDELSFLLAGDNNEIIALDDLYTQIKLSRSYYILINKDYNKIDLPLELQNFYSLIFPDTSSEYFKQFLLYSYLRIINATDRADDIKKYDTRLSYDLNQIEAYFNFSKLLEPVANNQDFKLSVSGKFTQDFSINSTIQNFIIKQIDDSSEVLIFSTTQGKFYKFGKLPSDTKSEMSVNIQKSTINDKVSNVVYIGDTGLNFIISSKNDLNTFSNTSNKLWVFNVYSPLTFNYSYFFNEFSKNPRIIENMLNYKRDLCDITYENIWRLHYNDVYKFAGLLLAYIERVNLLWQDLVM